jgi:hypothetical protein
MKLNGDNPGMCLASDIIQVLVWMGLAMLLLFIIVET